MTRTYAAFLLVTLLAACGSLGSSSLNPGNWFGRDREERINTVETAAYVDTRPLVAEVVALKVDRMPGGAIITTTGLPATQGYWGGELVALNDERPDKGVLSYEFRIVPPKTFQPVVNRRSREVVIGHFVSDQTLAGVRRIQVLARDNRRTVRR